MVDNAYKHQLPKRWCLTNPVEIMVYDSVRFPQTFLVRIDWVLRFISLLSDCRSGRAARFYIGRSLVNLLVYVPPLE